MSTETLNHTAAKAPLADDNAYELLAVSRTYATEAGGIEAVRNIDLVIGRGEYVVIEGPSGSGKSTLLQLMGMLDRPSQGRITCGGSDVSELSESELAELRLHKVGFIFQQFNLIPTLTAAQNVEIAMFPAATTKDAAKARALDLLKKVGLADRSDHYPGQLSGGEQQRVAIARALANEPEILLADEPTGNLDSTTSAEILELVHGLNATGLTVVLITHDRAIADAAPRTCLLRDGELNSQ
ncbi:MAG: ABC transporter ATP-binding protein [Thermoleophilaceae bacterium]|nr:ABC transporter ATP-binding protein [Thermoleophilaceae bacterium]